MARKKKGCGHSKKNHVESVRLNRRTYMMYRDWIMSLAIMRYRWINLPESCDSRYLEWTLLTQGVATISKADIETEDGTLPVWTSTQAATLSPPNIYDNYTHWQSFGNNGWQYDVSPMNGVLVWDNRLRYPIFNQIDLYAHKLERVSRTIDANLVQQMTSKVFTVPQERVFDLQNTISQTAAGEPYILGIEGLMKDMEVNVIGMETPLITENLQMTMENIWKEIYTFLGIENVNRKAERMLVDEIHSINAPANIRRLDGLQCRREACRELNRKWGLDVDVVWFEDFDTANFNTMENIEKLKGVLQNGNSSI